MDAATLLGLQKTPSENHFQLPVVPEICTGGGFLFGGSALGACICAMETATGRPVVWATGQYLAFARPGEVMDLEVVIAAGGKQTTQARVVGRVEDREILTVNGALGARSFPEAGVWAAMPAVPGPDECEPRPSPFPTERTIMARLDQRLVPDACVGGSPIDTGRTVLWSRMPDLMEMSAPALAVLGDYVPMGIGRAMGLAGKVTSNSLDNTLRTVEAASTDWVLLDINIDAVARGVGHGTVHLWAHGGELLAIASQSAKVRYRSEVARPV